MESVGVSTQAGDAQSWDVHMRRALALAVSPDAPRGENPRVGCVIVDVNGNVVGEGHHRGAGTAHAEVDALHAAGEGARGATAVVTLEPCRHTGRTGPCTQALVDAGIARVVYAADDPTDEAGGGAEVLRAAGIDVIGGVHADESVEVNRGWLSVRQHSRPYVTLKTAMSLDGRVADASGGPTRISGDAARIWSHELRGRIDAIAVGTGTVLADDPQLTARHPDGSLRSHQPVRVVIGRSAIPSDARVLDDTAVTRVFADHELPAVMRQLADDGIQELLIEGGPRLAAAALAAGVVDAVAWVIAPVILGAGPVAVSPDAAAAFPAGQRIAVTATTLLGEDVLVEGRIVRG